MSKLHTDTELELGRYGEYLLKSRIVPEKYASFYVGWVRRFLLCAPEQAGAKVEDRLLAFLDRLSATVAAWQLDQAERAVRIYLSNYLANAGTTQATTEIKPDPSGRIRKIEVLDAVRRLIRLRHYSYRTEQTYLDWLERFFRYLAGLDGSEKRRNCETGFRAFAAP